MTRRTPAQYDWTNALFNDRRITKHFTSPRRAKITHVTLHHMDSVSSGTDAGNTAVLEGCYKTWMGGRPASANYGVAGDQVWQFVSDNDAPWADANSTSNHSTLAIEHADSTGDPTYKISDQTMATGQRLVATLHRLYGLGRPSRKTVKVHRDFYATACPGPYMMAHLDAYIAAAAKFYDEAGTKPTTPPKDPKPVPVEPTEPKPTPEVPVPTANSCVFNYLGMNIYASQYTGGKFTTKRKAALKATFAGPKGANASWNALSEVNSPLDHATVIELLGKQFAHPDVYVRALGNNHHYPDANKWELTGKLEVDLGSTTAQARRITLATARHKATGIIVSFWATHFSSTTHGATTAQAQHSQIVEAKAVARIIAGKPLPDWDVAKSIGYADTNFDDAEKYIEPAGVKEIAHLVKITNGDLNSLHPLGKAPGKGFRRDNVYVGSDVTVRSARQITGLYDANDHLGQACQFEVAA